MLRRSAPWRRRRTGNDSGSGTGSKPEPEFTFTGNAGLFSDYRFRGFTQTDYKPAFQGGFDFAHKSGFYLGNWNSNVEQALYNGASLEMDFYGGYKHTFGDFGLDVGVIYYYYPGTKKVSAGRRCQELRGLHRRHVGAGVAEVFLFVHRFLRSQQRRISRREGCRPVWTPRARSISI